MASGPKISTIKRLYALSGNRCAFTGCTALFISETGVAGDICHIKAARSGGRRYDPTQSDDERHAFENLILLCPTHHRMIDSDDRVFTVIALTALKAGHEQRVGRAEQPADSLIAKALIANSRISLSDNTGNVAIGSPGAHQSTTNIHIKTAKKPTIAPPPNTIGADRIASAYVQHLINRYNKFASAYASRATKFSYGALSRTIASKFGSEWKLLPIERAHEVMRYVDERIGRTRMARTNASKGVASVSTYEAFAAKYRGSGGT